MEHNRVSTIHVIHKKCMYPHYHKESNQLACRAMKMITGPCSKQSLLSIASNAKITGQLYFSPPQSILIIILYSRPARLPSMYLVLRGSFWNCYIGVSPQHDLPTVSLAAPPLHAWALPLGLFSGLIAKTVKQSCDNLSWPSSGSAHFRKLL